MTCECNKYAHVSVNTETDFWNVMTLISTLLVTYLRNQKLSKRKKCVYTRNADNSNLVFITAWKCLLSPASISKSRSHPQETAGNPTSQYWEPSVQWAAL